MADLPRYEVGQKVWIYDINDRSGEPVAGTVTKIGRKIVTVTDERYRAETEFRMDTGRLNDRNYPFHRWIRTEEQRADDEKRVKLLAELRDYKLQPAGSGPSTAQLQAVVTALREVES